MLLFVGCKTISLTSPLVLPHCLLRTYYCRWAANRRRNEWFVGQRFGCCCDEYNLSLFDKRVDKIPTRKRISPLIPQQDFL